MKTSGMTEILPLTKKQKCACNVVMGVLLVAAGIILILAGAGVINTPVRKIAAPTILFAFAAALLFSAIVAKNSLSMWIAGVLFSCGLASLLDVTTPATYANLSPIYIAAPAVGCLAALIFSETKFALLKAILFFGGFAALFALQSSGTCGWGLTGGLSAAFGGVCVIVYGIDAYFLKKKKEGENA